MSNTKQQVRAEEETVEQMGVFFEKAGFSPVQGRVFAYLLLAEPPQKSFYEIQEFLKASKSSISIALKNLTERDMVEYITFSGDRKRYFKVDVEGWLGNTKEQVKGAAVFNNLVKNVLIHRQNSNHPDFNAQLEKVTEFYEGLSKAMDKFIDKWEKENE